LLDFEEDEHLAMGRVERLERFVEQGAVAIPSKRFVGQKLVGRIRLRFQKLGGSPIPL
jgi:hypothetical protein